MTEPILVQYNFDQFAGKFPPVDMPVTLGEDTHHVFSLENDPLPADMIRLFVLPSEQASTYDEFTEYVPCFSIAGTEDFIALVWWKASLLQYDYILATYTPKGVLIDRKVIASTRAEGDRVYRQVATINEELDITVAEGWSLPGTDAPDPESTRLLSLEIMANGEIAG